MKINLFYFISILILTLTINSPRAEEVPPEMYSFRSHLMELSPLMVSPQDFEDEKNDKLIREHLNALSELAKNLRKHDPLKVENFRIPAEVFRKHMQKTYFTFMNGNKTFARTLLRASLHGCSYCHTQIDPAAPSVFLSENHKVPSDPFERAELWYTIQQYPRAKKAYYAFISLYDQGNNNDYQLTAALRRLLTISIRVDKDLHTLLDVLDSLRNHPKLPEYVRRNVSDWRTDLQQLQKLKTPDASKVQALYVERYLNQIFNAKGQLRTNIWASKEVPMLHSSGLIFTFLAKQPKKITPKLLWLLGIANREVENDIFFAFGDTYLKSCIENFSKSPVARECFNTLKYYRELEYTGSAGTKLPEEDEQELKVLEDKLPKKK